MKIFDVREYGAVCNGTTLNTKAIQAAIDACAENGGGRVLFSEGVYMTGTIVLKSNVNLHIEANAVLLGSPDCADYPEHETTHVESKLLPRWRNACMIYADECENISLSGMGTIDCNGTHFVRELLPEEQGSWKYKRYICKNP
jgi:polygalacturonase